MKQPAWASVALTSASALMLALLAGCGTQAVNPVTGKTERLVMDERQEVATGQKNHAEVIKEYGLYPDPKVQAYVNQLGQKLAAQSHRAGLTWHFTVLDSPEINAFALPGGYVYVTRGIMAYLDSEADLAGVIGHEIGHVTARHGAQRATQQQNAGLGVLAASVLGAVLEAKGMSGAGRVASEVSQNVAAGLIASYGREQELQADALGAEYLARNQYDPANMIDVITVLKNQERFAADRAREAGKATPRQAGWLASHPSNDQRLQDIRQIAAKYPAKPAQGNYVDEGKARYRQILDGVTFGESPEQGVTRGQQFYHQGMGFAMTAPTGWSIQNGAQALTLINPEGSAGLVVRPVPTELGRSHDQIIRSWVKPTQGQLQAKSINGLTASEFKGQRRNAQGQAQDIRLTLVDGPLNHQYLLMPSARDANVMAQEWIELKAAENSFRALTEADKAAARPWQIKTAPYPRGGFAQLAKQSPLVQAPEAQLRLINGFYGAGEPKPGESVKVIVPR